MGEETTVSVVIPAEVDDVIAYGRMHVYFIQDSLNKVEISGGENVVKGIQCEITGNQLRLRDNNTCNWMRRLDQVPVVTVHYTTLHYFGAENYYDNLFLKTHTGDTILLEYWTGSGKTKFIGDVDRAYFKINAGNGNYECSGSADYCYVYHSGSGRMDCSALIAKDVLAATRSNNDVYVHCDSTFYCDIKRTGNVYLSGNPHQTTRIGLGSGQIIHL